MNQKKHKIESFKSCVVQFFTNISLQYRLISCCSILVERLFILFKNFLLLLYYTFPLLNCMERSLMRWHRGKIEIICTVSLSGERLIWVWDTKIIYGSRFHVKFLICQFLFLYLRIDFAPLFVKLLLAGEIWFSGVTWPMLTAGKAHKSKGIFQKCTFLRCTFFPAKMYFFDSVVFQKCFWGN